MFYSEPQLLHPERQRRSRSRVYPESVPFTCVTSAKALPRTLSLTQRQPGECILLPPAPDFTTTNKPQSSLSSFSLIFPPDLDLFSARLLVLVPGKPATPTVNKSVHSRVQSLNGFYCSSRQNSPKQIILVDDVWLAGPLIVPAC